MMKLFRAIRFLLCQYAGLERPLTWGERLVLHFMSVLCLLVVLVLLPFDQINYRRRACAAAQVAADERETWTPGTPYPPAGDAGSAVG